MSNVRVRFAPSPTGPLHIGGLRTALYNYLFARQNKGAFVLRIEDTDQSRYVSGAEDYIMETLEWCGISPDESPQKPGKYGPYRQSERKEMYKKCIQQLIDSGNCYYAFDTPEKLAELRAIAEAKKETFVYGHANRKGLDNSLNLSEQQLKEKLASGAPYVVRFRIEPNRELFLKDEIRGNIRIQTSNLDDKILFKSDGMPTYHLANIVDDHAMEITHVIRGEEWLPSLALHYLLYEAFGWEVPTFVHLPLLLKPEGKGKLSKRDGDKHGFPVFPLEWKTTESTSMGYREEGYLPQAVINMLALLGWNPGNEQEIFSLEELVDAFSFEQVSKSGAKFDPKKALWFNQTYVQRMPESELLKAYSETLKNKGLPTNSELDLKVAKQMQERVTFVNEIYKNATFFYVPPVNYEAKALKKAWKEDAPERVDAFIAKLETLSNFNAVNCKEALQNFVKEEEIGFGKIMMPVRLLLTGSLSGPDVFEIMEILGKEETITRLKKRNLVPAT